MGKLNRHSIKRLEQAAKGHSIPLRCPECGEEWKVAGDTDLEYIAHDWLQTAGPEHRYLPTPKDVLTLVAHPHPVEELVDTRTGEKWLKWVDEAGYPLAQ